MTEQAKKTGGLSNARLYTTAEFAEVMKERDDLKKALAELVEAEEAEEAALLTRETLMDKEALEQWMSARNLKVSALAAAKKLLEDK